LLAPQHLATRKPRQFAKQPRAYGSPVAVEKEFPTFIDPPLTNRTNLNLPLEVVVPHVSARVQDSGKLVFHTVGDTGGIHGTDVQESIAEAMVRQFSAAEADQPAFFYNLGDVVYFNGQRALYRTQFYEPYQHYPAPIFAIPGNHDGDTFVRKGDEPDPDPTLAGFMENFCDDQPRYNFPYRQTMTQPYAYWTLETPVATIVGLYSNVDGSLDGRAANEQQRWFQQQLQDAPTDKWLLIAVHHPPYSLDSTHGGSPDIGLAIDSAIDQSGRMPDLVLTGHVHNYQRFTRSVANRKIPYVVAGAGGYANTLSLLHKLQKNRETNRSIDQETLPYQTLDPQVALASTNRQASGFLRITATRQQTLKGEYFLVPFDGTPPVQPFDHFVVNWENHSL
jgi:hypothetical protein